MTFYTPDRIVGAMRRTPVVLAALLDDVTPEQAQLAKDGPDGWSVVEIVCHLRDFEEIFFARARLTQEQDVPTLAPRDHETMAIERDYQHQDLRQALADLRQTRAAFREWLKQRSPDDWQRHANHPENGPMTILDMALQTVLHDTTHLEQIARVLAECRVPSTGYEPIAAGR